VRILFLSTSMGLGGADQQLLSAAQVLRARGHDILIVSLTPLGPMGLEARASGLRTESLEMARGIPDPRGLYRLAKLARAWKPEVVHSHMVHANLMARALRLVVPVPVLVSTIHNIYEGGAVWMAAYRLTNRLVDHMTIISEAAADRFIGERIVPRALLTVVPNGIDTGWRSDASRTPRTIPTCCARSRRCGHASRARCSCWSDEARCRTKPRRSPGSWASRAWSGSSAYGTMCPW
jgi:hypothetical protein